MKRVLFIFFLFPCLVCGQSRYYDSLAVYRYCDLYESSIYSNRPVAKKALDSLNNIVKNNRYPKAVYYYHSLSGDYYFNLHELPLSQTHYRKAVQIAENLGLVEETAHNKVWLGNLNYFDKKYDEATRWYKEAYAFSEKNNYIDGMCNALYGLSSVESDYHKTMELLIKIDSIYTRNNQISPILGNAYEGMANLYLNTHNDSKTATAYYEKALSVHKRTNFPYGISHIIGQLGEIALREDDLVRAKSFFEDLYNEDLKRKDTLNQVRTLTRLAEVDRRLKNYSEAEKKVLEAMEHYVEKNDFTALVEARLMLARIYIEMQKPELSNPHLDYANSHYQNSLDTLGFKIKLLTAEVDYHTFYKNFETALKKQQEIDQTKAIQTRLINEKQFLELETQYRTAQKEQQIELLSTENELAEQKRKNQLTFFVVIVALLLIVGLSMLFAYRNKMKTAQKIRELNQMKSRFFANISHEFRTPLTLIKSPLQTLQAGMPDEKQQKQLSLIGKNSDRMLELIDQLLELSKIDSGKLNLILKEGNISSFLQSVTEPFEYQAKEKNLKFSSTIENSEKLYSYDKDVIEKIVTNLLSNAVKYTPENYEMDFVSVIENENLQIRVSNSGSGLKKSDLPKLFERFYQKDGSRQGFGIGLALIKELVDLYKGKIETSLNDGILSFEVTLPLTKNESENIVIQKENLTADEIQNTEIESDNELPVVLIVDDNSEIRNVLKGIFSDNYTVLEAENGKTALKLAQKEIPDCIISDVIMPEMDGFKFTQAIKENELTSFIPVILLTAKTSDEDRLESLKNEADAFLTKPFNNEILKETVIRQIAERKKLRERYSRELILKPVDIAINTVDEKFLEKLGVVMEKHLSDTGFSTDDFASEMNMSRMQLHRKLKSLLNVSATEFIRNERLKTAAELMKKGNKNISEIAYTVGFNDVSYFSKCFKELYNVTPSEFVLKI